MTHVTRIVEQLNWTSLKEAYFIGTRTVEELKRNKAGAVVLTNGEPTVVKTTKFINELLGAIEAGTIDALVEESARLYHGGNTQAVLTAIARNLDSQRCNLKARTYAPNKKIDEIRLETLTTFINSRREAKVRTIGALPQWAFGVKEIDEITDVAKLQKVINSINDACCDKADGAYAKHLGPDYIAVAKANRIYAQKRKEALQAEATKASPDILAKLVSGNAVKLTPEEAAQLLKILHR